MNYSHRLCIYWFNHSGKRNLSNHHFSLSKGTSKWLIPLDSFWQGIHLIYYDLCSPHFKHYFGKTLRPCFVFPAICSLHIFWSVGEMVSRRQHPVVGIFKTRQDVYDAVDG